jgi:hypothetical protein
VLSGEATHTRFMVFGLTRPGREPTIYRTRGEHAWRLHHLCDQHRGGKTRRWRIKEYLEKITDVPQVPGKLLWLKSCIEYRLGLNDIYTTVFRIRLFNSLTQKTVVLMICNMKPHTITSRSLIIARLSESNKTTAQI